MPIIKASISSLLITTIVFLGLDSIYLFTMRDFFNKVVHRVQGSPLQINLVGAILCYATLVAGLFYFILRTNASLMDAFLLGLFVYGVYETTTYALLKNWSFKAVILDTTWGGILFALSSIASVCRP